MKRLFTLLLLLSSLTISAQIQSPEEFLGYELGSKFTFHHKVVDYFKYLAETSPQQLTLHQYGETYEGRLLFYAVLSSASNMQNIESIKEANLQQTGLSSSSNQQANKAIIWMSYNIHGNEASSTEAVMKTAHALLTGAMNSNEWLENTVVILDPCINPDGRDRYANFYRQYGAKDFNPNLETVEHQEPWPGGRPNHYLFDLNRDWAWQSQQESQLRMVAYHEWMPHIHVDFHEQGINNPYYFAPAAEPLHKVITPWQREFQIQIGQNHAKYFDANNWLYFTRERFDLFYPSYGDTYPTFNGAIGMTYEQAGSGRAGVGGLTDLGDTLTLADRLEHHYTTGMSTVEIASKNAEKLNQEFAQYFNQNINNPQGEFKSYIVRWAAEKENDLNELKLFLDKQKIQYGELATNQSLRGYSYLKRADVSVTGQEKDLVISAYQPKSTLINALFDPKPEYSDSLTYDITAWAVPYAFGLETIGLKNNVVGKEIQEKSDEQVELQENAYAYIIPWTDFNSAQLLADLLKAGVKIRIAYQELQFSEQKFSKGSLVITQRNNEHMHDLRDILSEFSQKHHVAVVPILTGFADKLYDIGSGEINYLKPPKIAVLMDEGVSSLAYGEVWHYFEQQLDYPIQSIRLSTLSRLNLVDYDVLVMPSGAYKDLGKDGFSQILDYVKSGGKVIAMGSANQLFAKEENSTIAFKEEEEDTSNKNQMAYKDAERSNLSQQIFGAIYEVKLDQSHPLAFGYQDKYFSLKTSADALSYMENGWNVGTIESANKHIAGFAGYKANRLQAESTVFGVEEMGNGQIIYLMDDPLFRAFWHHGKLLFANAVFMVGND